MDSVWPDCLTRTGDVPPLSLLQQASQDKTEPLLLDPLDVRILYIRYLLGQSMRQRGQMPWLESWIAPRTLTSVSIAPPPYDLICQTLGPNQQRGLASK